MATIEQHNQERLRKPMVVEIDMSIPSNGAIRQFTVQSGYKLYDSTLNNTTFPLRVLADLQGPGFKLDGTAELYDSTVDASETNGKIGLRGNVGEPLTVYASALYGTFLKAITVRSEGAKKIESDINGVYDLAQPVTRAVVFDASSSISATLTFYPKNELTRVVVDSIVPGAFFEIREDNLVSAQLELRTCLDDIDPKWEESTLDVSWLNSADIAQLLLNTPYETPITYRAGYQDAGATADMSAVRYFYVTEAIKQQDDIISLQAKDASHRLEGITLPEGDLLTYPGFRRTQLYANLWLGTFEDRLATVLNSVGAGGTQGINHIQQETSVRAYKINGYHIRPQMSFKDFFAQALACAEVGYSGLFYVDAGRPTFSLRNDAMSTWAVDSSKLSRFEKEQTPLVSKIVDLDETHYFDAKMTDGAWGSLQIGEEDFSQDSFYEVDTGSLNWFVSSAVLPSGGASNPSQLIEFTPTKSTFKSVAAGQVRNTYWTLKETGGVPSIWLRGEGVQLNIEPPIWGNAIFRSDGLDYFNLFDVAKRSGQHNKKIKFTWKGDPRWQPRDILNIAMDDGTTERCLIESISMKHEGGGTIADIIARK